MYVGIKFNDPSIIKNTDHVDFSDKNLDNVRFIKVNSKPILEEHLTLKIYVDQAISDGVDESTLLRLDLDEKLRLNEQDSTVLNFTLTLPKTIFELPTKSYVDIRLIEPSIIRNTAHVDFNDKNLDNVRFVKVNSLPAVREHLTTKFYVDDAIYQRVHECSLLRLDRDETFKLDEHDSKIFNSTVKSPKTIIGLPTKSNVDSLHEINRNRQDLSSVFNNQDNEFDIIQLTNLDSITINTNLSSDNEVSKK